MTTFERFQRDARARMNSHSSSRKKSQISTDHNLRNLLTFSAREILFIYDSSKHISTFCLKITNHTGYKVHFKVRNNNSEGYFVSPYEEVVNNREEILVNF